MERLYYVRDALLQISDNVFHIVKKGKVKDRYFVWQEDSESSNLHADNSKMHQTIEGTIDYFTTKERDSAVDDVQRVLNEKKISFRLNTVQYEDNTGLIHYEWIFNI